MFLVLNATGASSSVTLRACGAAKMTAITLWPPSYFDGLEECKSGDCDYLTPALTKKAIASGQTISGAADRCVIKAKEGAQLEKRAYLYDEIKNGYPASRGGMCCSDDTKASILTDFSKGETVVRVSMQFSGDDLQAISATDRVQLAIKCESILPADCSSGKW